jgi:ABC-type transport system involved in multi-copper enzyme maturation permease subunit
VSSELALGGTSRVPFARLARVELRKTWDTKSGLWLLVAIVGLLVVVPGIALIITLVNTDPILLDDFVAIAAYMMSFLLPLLAIMLVTTEWSQRTALVTFTLEPRRSRVVLAKLAAALLLTVINLVAALAIGVLYTAICEAVQPDQTTWRLDGGNVAGFVIPAALAMLGGFAIATLLLNTPASIVLFVVYRFVLPGVFAALAALSDAMGKVIPWVDFQGAQVDIYNWELSGAEAWGHLIVSGAIWLALPLGLGLWRILRAEVK